MRFSNKVALVTGAGSGIGKAIATRLARDGAEVIVTDITGKEAEVAAGLGGNAIARGLDVGDETDVVALERWIRAEYGRLDLLANNAGIGGAQCDLANYPIDEFDRVMAINVRGAYLVLQAGLRLMLESGGGAIVNTASVGGFRATPMSSAYIISKGASVMMTKVAAIENADKGIRVNAIAPGVTKTAILDNSDAEILEMLEAQVPQKRLGTAEECANVAAFLLDGTEAAHVTGQIWLIDGGRSAG